MKQWAPGELVEESIFAYATAQMIVEVLKRCGDDLSRENLLRQATNIQGLQLPLFLPGVKINISPTSRIAWRQTSMARFDGSKWVLFGDILAFPAGN
jgi:branched-chain amino acid transport system substrate-binding protein